MLEKQKEELNQINKTKDKMFLIVGHDLRGPVGNLKSLIEMLLEDEEVVKSKSLMETFSIFMKSIQSVGDLLEQLFKTIADHKGIKLNVDMPDYYDVFADKNMLMTVVRNILSNAIKYTPKNGNISIKVEKENQFYKVTIKDSGIGFNDETAKKILDANSFYTTVGTNNEAGSGLGLLLSKEFVERNGGQIWAESKPDQGAYFYFTVPVANF